MNVGVLGCGRWGSFVAWYLNKQKHNVTLYGREDSENLKRIKNTRSNGVLTFDDSIRLTASIEEALDADVIAVSVGAQNLRDMLRSTAAYDVRDKIFLLCMKGLENSTSKRLSVVASEELHPSNSIAVWLGPGHSQDFARGVPSYMLIDSNSAKTKSALVDAFSSRLIHMYYGDDLLGNEIGAAAKNIIGLVAGALDAMDMSALKGALISRGAYEVSLLIAAMGGNPLSAYGLCHLGDYAATVFSKYSHNRQFGESFILGKQCNVLAEGYYTVPAIVRLSEEYGVKMPICRGAYEVLYNGLSPNDALESMLARTFRQEYHL